MYWFYELSPQRRQAAIEKTDLLCEQEGGFDWGRWHDVFAGTVGEHAVFTYFDDRRFGIRESGQSEFDFILQCYTKQIRIEVKTTIRKHKCRPNYACNVNKAAKNWADIYIFCSAFFPKTRDSAHCQGIEVCGWLSSEEVFKKAVLVEAGQRYASGQQALKDTYEIETRLLRPLAELEKFVAQ